MDGIPPVSQANRRCPGSIRPIPVRHCSISAFRSATASRWRSAVRTCWARMHSTDATGNRSETHACAPSRIAGAAPSITVGRVPLKNSWTVGLTITCIYAAVSSQTRSHRPIHRADLGRTWWPRPKGCRNARRSPLSVARKVVARCRLDPSHAFSTGRQSRPIPHRFEYLARQDREH